MDNQYLIENQEAIQKLIAAMVPAFQNNNFVNKVAPIDNTEVVVVSKKEKPRRFGVNVNGDGEQYIFKNVLLLTDYLVKKYKLDKYAAEKIASDLMGYHILEAVYKQAGLEYSSNYAKYVNKREKYTLYKGIVFVIAAILFALFLILN